MHSTRVLAVWTFVVFSSSLFAGIPAQVPLHFERADADTFIARGAGYSFGIRSEEAVAVLDDLTLRLQFEGAREAKISGEALLPGQSHYLIGKDPSCWRIGVPQYRKVVVPELYDGIDLVYYGNGRQLEYDFVVKPGADPFQIRVFVDGAERIETSPDGDLILHTSRGELHQLAPVAYQTIRGQRRRIAASYALFDSGFAFRLGSYDANEPLIIDPVLVYSTYLGGSAVDAAEGVALDSTGNMYVAGYVTSTNFPTANAFQAALGGPSDAFVTKLNAAGTALAYSTYIGGGGGDTASSIAVDATGAAYVVGDTASADFPTANAIQPTTAGTDGFLLKLSPAGSALVYSTYLGGTGEDFAHHVALDPAGNAYVAGSTMSSNFPTANAIQAAYGGSRDGFVLKVNPAGSAFVYSTYLGGTGLDIALGIDVDAAGSGYVTGWTNSLDFPTVNPIQASRNGLNDAFVTKLNAAGNAFVFSSYLGGSGTETGYGIAVDDAGVATATGETRSADFPTANAIDPLLGGTSDAYVTKLNAAGTAFIYSTYLGGSGGEVGEAVTLDGSGGALVTGQTLSADFPTVQPIQAAFGGVVDAFLSQLHPSGTSLLFSTYLGGSSGDAAKAVAAQGSNAVLAGVTGSPNFPTVNPLQAANAGSQDAWIAKIAFAGITVTPTSGLTTTEGGGTAQFTVRLNSRPSASVTIQLSSDRVAEGTVSAPSVTFTDADWDTPQTVIVTGVDDAVADGDQSYNIITGAATSADADYAGIDPDDVSVTNIDNEGGPADLSIVKTLTSSGPFTAGGDLTYSIAVTNNGPSAATGVTVTDPIPPTTTLVSANTTQGTCSGTTTVTCSIGTLANGGTATVTLTVRTSSTPGPVTNTASVDAVETDPGAGNDASTAPAVTTVARVVEAIPTLSALLLMMLGALLAVVAMMKLHE
jgi:uncharacterized repeat protein (TIGR01451 family)